MERFYFLHNMDTCIGCACCQVACKDLHDLAAGEAFRRTMELKLPGGELRFYSAACNHCSEPACSAACDNGAYFVAPDGTVCHDANKCIGCGKCMWSCPYGAVHLSRVKGVAAKCDGCYERRRQGLEPACVAACINRSLSFHPAKDFTGQKLFGSIPGVLPDAEASGSGTRIRCSHLDAEEAE